MGARRSMVEQVLCHRNSKEVEKINYKLLKLIEFFYIFFRDGDGGPDLET